MTSRVCIAALLLVGITFAIDGPDEARPKPIQLTAGSSRVLPLPSFAAEIGPQCDSTGNLFFRTGYTLKRTVVLKVASTDGSPTVFRPRDDKADGSEFIAFHVGIDGKVRLLVRGKRDEAYVYEFMQEDPANSVSTRLELPDGLDVSDVRSFLALPNEHFLLQGYFGQNAPKDKKGREYLAEFSQAGKLVRMNLDSVTGDLLKAQANHMGQTAAAQGQDGTTYLLTGDLITVIAPTGTVQRRIKLSPPDAGFNAELLYMHKGRLVVGFVLSRVGKTARVAYELLDPDNGDLIRLYEPSPELGQNLVCWSDDGLTFMRSESGNVKLITAPIK